MDSIPYDPRRIPHTDPEPDPVPNPFAPGQPEPSNPALPPYPTLPPGDYPQGGLVLDEKRAGLFGQDMV